MDWCFRAAHRAAAATPTTSLLAISLETAPSDDEDFLRWLYKIDCTQDAPAVMAVTSGAVAPTTMAAVAPPTTPRGVSIAAAHTTTMPPGPDVWERMAASISSSFASAAAALKPPPADPIDGAYDTGACHTTSFKWQPSKDLRTRRISRGFQLFGPCSNTPRTWKPTRTTSNGVC